MIYYEIGVKFFFNALSLQNNFNISFINIYNDKVCNEWIQVTYYWEISLWKCWMPLGVTCYVFLFSLVFGGVAACLFLYFIFWFKYSVCLYIKSLLTDNTKSTFIDSVNSSQSWTLWWTKPNGVLESVGLKLTWESFQALVELLTNFSSLGLKLQTISSPKPIFQTSGLLYRCWDWRVKSLYHFYSNFCWCSVDVRRRTVHNDVLDTDKAERHLPWNSVQTL